ncbi:MAG: hypothetical protein DME05_19965 [Candidatus Rokuibacteriota bacterium]|nr:MAG: hypothetical protein DME05_19965 [Candidatus Rokubacteria bacterium]
MSKTKFPFGCLTTKKPTGTVTCVLGAPDCSALFAIVSPPELKAYSFIPAGPAACDSETKPTSNTTTTVEIRPRVVRCIRVSSLLR